MASSAAVFEWGLNGANLNSTVGTGIPTGGESTPNSIGANVLSTRIFNFSEPPKGSTAMLAITGNTVVVAGELWTRDNDGVLWLKVASFTGAQYDVSTPSATIRLEKLFTQCVFRFTSLSVAGVAVDARLFIL